ncbi:MAG TPA: glycosyltransferase family 4 protein [Cyclobacteriaceae bacterium]|nr:glycosyltransferase family 4 protein [Cyclobacteriaceae bacterium]
MASHKNTGNKLVFIVPYPFDQAPGQRFRYEQYLTTLKQRGFVIEIHSFLNEKAYSSFYESNKLLQKIRGITTGFLKRIYLLFKLKNTGFIFIYREATPLGPPFFEFIVAKWLMKKIIYDFDDAIWITDNSSESKLLQYLKWRNKISKICRWSYKVSAGNEYLYKFARQHNNNVTLNPTTIATNSLNQISVRDKVSPKEIFVGWTGSHSTLKYLQEIEDALQCIEEKYENVKFLIIANKAPTIKLKRIEFLPWRKESELSDLAKIDIGIMPLPNDEWTKGKCGFKALQYMAMGIPAVASPIGVNTTIIKHNENGFLASANNEWVNFLSLLIESSELRSKLGKAGKQFVINHYSVSSNTSNFLSLFE